jgi:predicted nucleic acid binding AN1-type Zn finger protein
MDDFLRATKDARQGAARRCSSCGKRLNLSNATSYCREPECKKARRRAARDQQQAESMAEAREAPARRARSLLSALVAIEEARREEQLADAIMSRRM